MIAISALSALQLPYQYGSGNQVFQLPTVHRLLQPELYPGDALVESLRNYPSAAYPIIAWLSRTSGIGIEPLYLAIWVALRITIVGLLFILAARFVPDYWGRVFVALAAATTGWSLTRTLIGGEHIFAVHLTHTELAFALQLAALAACLYRRPVPGAVLAAGALYLNAMTTVHFLGFMVLLWALGGRRRDRRYLLGLVTFLALAMPYALELRAALAGASGAAHDTARFWELLRIRHGPHYFLNVWDMATLASIAVVFALIGRRPGIDATLRRMMLAGAAYTAVMFLLALLGVSWGSSKLVVLLHPLRGDKWLHVALILAVPIFLWREALAAQSRAQMVMLPALAAVFMLGYAPPGVALWMAPVVAAGAVLVAAGRVAWAGPAGLCAVAGAVLMALPGNRMFGAALLLGLAVGTLARRIGYTRPALIAVVAIIALLQIGRNSFDLSNMRLDWYRAGEDRAWVDVAMWADMHTPITARFITPPWREGWRCLSRRATLVQYRDGSAMHWEAGFEAGWWERLAALNCDVYYSEDALVLELMARYLALTPADLVAAAERYDIDYVVMPRSWPSADAIAAVYANSGYAVFTIDALRASTPPQAAGT